MADKLEPLVRELLQHLQRKPYGYIIASDRPVDDVLERILHVLDAPSPPDLSGDRVYTQAEVDSILRAAYPLKSPEERRASLTPPEPEGEPVAWKPRDGHTVHDLKCWPEFYRAVKRGEKPWELRDNDRDYRQGDILRLREWEPGRAAFTGDESSYGVGFILHGAGDWLPVGKCIMTLIPLFTRPAPGISVEEIAEIIDPWAMTFRGYNALANYKKQEALKLAQAIADRMGGERG